MPILRYWDTGAGAWRAVSGANGLPSGGTQGAVLVKNSATDRDIAWSNPSGQVVQDQRASYNGGAIPSGSTNTAWAAVAQINWMPMTKQFAGTVYRIQYGISAYAAGAGAIYFGVSPTNSTSNVLTVGNAALNTASDHRAFTGMRDLTGLAAGYNPPLCLFCYQCQSGTTWYSDANDFFWWRVTEVWP